ncbi:MAG: glucose-6-phosphate dehydrogenase assembly protein OpcA [Parachlamydiales bacterium]|nr:glucose-6-phosphate dehydrogenase assembly protein OpcA [Parachlamydiales bacterium]
MADDIAMNTITVSCDLIEKELSNLWNKESPQKTKASLFTLVLFSANSSREPYLHDIIHAVIEHFPCRIIFISFGHETLESQISLMSPKNHLFACDYIHFTLPSKDLNLFLYLIHPHLIPDLPSYLLWGADLKTYLAMPSLKSLFHRIIFDSEFSPNLPHFASTLLHTYKKEQIEIGDLNWARIENWRNLFSMVFSKNQENLKNIHSIKIVYNSLENQYFCYTTIKSIYLQAWLATRLHWDLQEIKKKEGNLSFSYRGKKFPILIEIIPQEISPITSGSIYSVKIQTNHNKEFLFQRDRNDLSQIRIDISTAHHCETPYFHNFEQGKRGYSLVKEIYYQKISPHFLDLLEYLQKMNQGNIC